MHEIKVGGVTIMYLGHASFVINGSKIIYIDPFVIPGNARQADYIFVTHEHFDHFNMENINKLRMGSTKIIATGGCRLSGSHTYSASAGDAWDFPEIHAEAVQAYNINKFHAPGQPFHPKGLGVGYVIEIDGVRIYHSGDTDNIPEMKNIKNIDVALLPIGGTYTMDPVEAAEATSAIKPKVAIPMHYNSDKYGVKGLDQNPNDFKKTVIDVDVEILTPSV